MPAVGLGTYLLGDSPDPSARDADLRGLHAALEAGYRHIDTATVYGNEAFLGAALAEAGIPRADLFLTSKLRNDEHRDVRYREALEASLEALRTDYLDLYLIHWPLPSLGRFTEAFDTLLEAREEGLVHDVGVANFLPAHLDRLVSECGEAPAVDQIEFHPSWSNPETFARCRELGVQVVAYSPLARGADFGAPAVQEAAAAHGATAAQVVLTWALQQGVAVIPKSANPDRLGSNLAVGSEPPPFELSPAEMEAISALDGTGQMGHDPATYERMRTPPAGG